MVLKYTFVSAGEITVTVDKEIANTCLILVTRGGRNLDPLLGLFIKFESSGVTRGIWLLVC